MDHNKVMEFLGQFVSDMGATGSAGQVAIGNRLGLYGSLAEGPATPEEFAQRTGYALRYLTEWLRGQAAGGYVSYDPASGQFSLTEEQAFCLADPNGPNVSAAVLTHPGLPAGRTAARRGVPYGRGHRLARARPRRLRRLRRVLPPGLRGRAGAELDSRRWTASTPS